MLCQECIWSTEHITLGGVGICYANNISYLEYCTCYLIWIWLMLC